MNPSLHMNPCENETKAGAKTGGRVSPVVSDDLLAEQIPDLFERELSNLCRTFRGGLPLTEMIKKHRTTKSYTTLTGELFALKKNIGAHFDSPLSRDYMVTLDFNPEILSFEPKPLTLTYTYDRKRRTYTPQLIVHFCRGNAGSKSPWLVDVRSERDLKINQREFDARFTVAETACKERGWTFKVFSEKDIRTPYLSNARFLLPFRRYDAFEPEHTLLREAVPVGGSTTPAEMIAAVESRMKADASLRISVAGDEATRQGRLLSMVWKLAADGVIVADYHRAKIDVDTKVWSPTYGNA